MMVLILFALLLGAGAAGAGDEMKDLQSDIQAYFTNAPPTYAGIDMTTCAVMSLWIEKNLPLGALDGPPYRQYRSWDSYQLELLNEMCLSWYLMQQPKNHGLLQSHGAPNF